MTNNNDFIPFYSIDKTRGWGSRTCRWRWWRTVYTGLELRHDLHVQVKMSQYFEKKKKCQARVCVEVCRGEGWKSITLKVYSIGTSVKKWSHFKVKTSTIQDELFRVTVLTRQTPRQRTGASQSWLRITSSVKSHLQRWKYLSTPREGSVSYSEPRIKKLWGPSGGSHFCSRCSYGSSFPCFWRDTEPRFRRGGGRLMLALSALFQICEQSDFTDWLDPICKRNKRNWFDCIAQHSSWPHLFDVFTLAPPPFFSSKLQSSVAH